jgi:hypothetical protein
VRTANFSPPSARNSPSGKINVRGTRAWIGGGFAPSVVDLSRATG